MCPTIRQSSGPVGLKEGAMAPCVQATCCRNAIDSSSLSVHFRITVCQSASADKRVSEFKFSLVWLTCSTQMEHLRG